MMARTGEYPKRTRAIPVAAEATTWEIELTKKVEAEAPLCSSEGMESMSKEYIPGSFMH